MKKFLSLILSYIMLFNLTATSFAQLGKSLSDAQKKMQREAEKFKIYQNVLDDRIKNPEKYKNEAPGAAQRQADMAYLSHLEKELMETGDAQEMQTAKMLGADYNEFKAAMEAYSKETGEDIDIAASWNNYIKELDAYSKDYNVLIKKFDTLTYMDILTEAQPLIGQDSTRVNYDGREYDKTAFLHAAIHNLAGRTKSGYVRDGVWIWSKTQEDPFTIEQKLSVMDLIYSIIAQYGYYPTDRQLLWAFAYKIVENGQKYFENDRYKADRFPNISNADDRQKRDQGRADRQNQASAVASAMAVLPILSILESEKEQSTEVIYKLIKDTLDSDYVSISLLTGSQALIALNTEESLWKIFTIVTEEAKESKLKHFSNFVFGSLSAEEITNMAARTATKGSYQYNNSVSRGLSYLDQNKNSKGVNAAVENDPSYNAIYTNIFEEIGRELGVNNNRQNVLSVSNIFASRLVNLGMNDDFSDDDVEISVVSGILETTKVHSDQFKQAANLIYDGYWWDINEATQRDKNNIAARYLGKPEKEYNKDKDNAFKTILYARNKAQYVDFVQVAISIVALVVSAPAIIRNLKNFAKSARSAKKTSGAVEKVNINLSQKKPISYSSNVRVASNTSRTAASANTAATSVNTAREVNTATKATQAARAAEPVKVAKTQAEIIAETQAQAKQAFDELGKQLFGEVKTKKAAASTILPLPEGVMDVLMGGEFPSLSQFINRSPRIQSMFDASVEKTLKAIEKEGLHIDDAKAFFVRDLSARFDLSPMVNSARKASILDEASRAFGVSLESVKGAQAGGLNALKGLDERDIEAFTKVGLLDDANYPKVQALLEKGVDKNTIYFYRNNLSELYNTQVVMPARSSVLAKNGFDPMDIEAFTKEGLLEADNYSRVLDLLEKGVDKMEIYRASRNGVLNKLYDDMIKIEPRKQALIKRGFDERDIEAFTKEGLLEDDKYLQVQDLLENGVEKSTIYFYRNNLSELYHTQVVMPARRSYLTRYGLDERDIEAFTSAGLLEDVNYSKVQTLLDNGVDKVAIYRAAKNGNLDEEVSRVLSAAKTKQAAEQKELRKFFNLDDEPVATTVSKQASSNRFEGFNIGNDVVPSQSAKQTAKNTNPAPSSVDKTVVKTKEGNTITAESYWEDIPTTGQAKPAVEPTWKSGNFTSEEIKALNGISENIGVENMNFLAEKGLSAKEISYLYQRHSDIMKEDFGRIKQLLSEDIYVTDIDAILSGRPTSSDLINSMRF